MYELGQHIAYVLLPRDLPTNPDHEYHGIIISIDGNQIHVQLTDPAYEGYDEWIDVKQIRSSIMPETKEL
jgi:hypothetical protein